MTIPSTLELNQPKPFLKWVGGKRALVDEIIKRMPSKFNTYFEPFVGGGALFFELKKRGMLEDKKSCLFDANKELINTYNTVKNNPYELIEILKEFQNKHSHDFYYEIRAMDREGSFASLPDAMRSARFIYLNKTCFNGLYRVNSKGFYNVPMGRYKNPAICDTSSILSASRALQDAEVLHVDFSKVLDFAKKGDFVYFDPPYYPLTPTSSFTSYNQDVFLDDEQKRLFNTFEKLAEKGLHVMLSNSDTEFIKELYKDYKIDFVEMNRFINSKSGGRGKIKEILIRNIDMSTFTRTTNYPVWNTEQKIVPDIPNWTHTIGSYTISFQKGAKKCFVTKVYSGDYTVHISSTNQNWSNHQYTDPTLWERLLIPNIALFPNKQNKQSFIDTLRHILTLKIENIVVTNINKTTFCDELKVCLYTLWHRAIIEDRLYPMPKFLGHKQVIGITIAIVKKIMGDTFPNDSLIQIKPFQLKTDLKCKECAGFYTL